MTNLDSIHKEYDDLIFDVTKDLTEGVLVSLIKEKLSQIELKSFPDQSIVSMLVSDLGIQFKTHPNTHSFTLRSLVIEDKDTILKAINNFLKNK